MIQTDWTVFLPAKILLLLARLQQRRETDHKARLGQCTSIGLLRMPAAVRPPVKVGLVVAVEPPLHKGPIEIRYFEGRAWGPPQFLASCLPSSYLDKPPSGVN